MTRNSGVPPTPTVQNTLEALTENTANLKHYFPPNPEYASLDWLEQAEMLLYRQLVYVERLTNFLHPHLDQLILYRLQTEGEQNATG